MTNHMALHPSLCGLIQCKKRLVRHCIRDDVATCILYSMAELSIFVDQPLSTWCVILLMFSPIAARVQDVLLS